MAGSPRRGLDLTCDRSYFRTANQLGTMSWDNTRKKRVQIWPGAIGIWRKSLLASRVGKIDSTWSDFSRNLIWAFHENLSRKFKLHAARSVFFDTVPKAYRRFDSRWCHWNFSMTYSFRSHYGPGVDSASNRNEYQEYFLG